MASTEALPRVKCPEYIFFLSEITPGNILSESENLCAFEIKVEVSKNFRYWTTKELPLTMVFLILLMRLWRQGWSCIIHFSAQAFIIYVPPEINNFPDN